MGHQFDIIEAHCVKNDSFSYSVQYDRKKVARFELRVSPVLRQSQDIWNFHGSLTLNNGTLIDILEALGMPLCEIWLTFSFCLAGEKNALFEVWVSPVLMQNPDI